MKHLVIIVSILLLAACVTVVRPSQGIYSGDIAYVRGDYAQAKNSYYSALQVAMQQNWKPHIASAKYGLGRSLGQLCEFNEAEKYLTEAANLESEISGGKGAHLSQDYFELARLYYDYGAYAKAIPFFHKALPIVEELGVASSDPIGYANVLENYAVALAKSGDTTAANAIERKIANLRQSNPGKNAGFNITRFNPNCTPNKAVQQTTSQLR